MLLGKKSIYVISVNTAVVVTNVFKCETGVSTVADNLYVKVFFIVHYLLHCQQSFFCNTVVFCCFSLATHATATLFCKHFIIANHFVTWSFFTNSKRKTRRRRHYLLVWLISFTALQCRNVKLVQLPPKNLFSVCGKKTVSLHLMSFLPYLCEVCK
jgi:hypothetical protein